MPELAGTILSIIFVGFFFGFSIFIHELGHMLAALWRGMHVDKFSIGFGHRILAKRWKNIDFIIGWLPFGGYVALPQMDASGEPQTEEGKPLPEAKPLDRIITALAGPAFNIIFALVLGTAIYFIGRSVPMEAEGVEVREVPKESIEYTQGLKEGDVITSINGKRLNNMQGFIMGYMMSDGVTLKIDREGKEMVIGPFTPPKNPNYDDLRLMGFDYTFLRPAVFGAIVKDSPADLAGLQKGDVLKSIDGKEVKYFHEIGETLNSSDALKHDLVIERNGESLTMTIEPKINKKVRAGMIFRNFPTVMEVQNGMPASDSGLEGGDEILEVNGYPVTDLKDFKGVVSRHEDEKMELTVARSGEKIKIEMNPTNIRKELGVYPPSKLVHISPITQIARVVENTFDTVRALVSPKSGVDISMMSSFVGISSGMYKTVKQLGIVEGLSFVLMINVALAIFNLLPFPVLDGGHIVVAFLEMISRRKVPAGVLQPIYVAFMLLLITFALYATFNDIRREVDTRELVYQDDVSIPDKIMRN